jgi:hypothetical protein
VILLISASRIARIIGVSHHTQLDSLFILYCLLFYCILYFIVSSFQLKCLKTILKRYFYQFYILVFSLRYCVKMQSVCCWRD